jgi:hypothetical protein
MPAHGLVAHGHDVTLFAHAGLSINGNPDSPPPFLKVHRHFLGPAC